MLNQAFWGNGAWLLQFQLRSKFRVGVCYIKQCCVLNKEAFVEDYESLAASAEKEADSGVSRKAELDYFATKTSTNFEQSQSKSKGKPSLRQTLSYTNKVLFGPLLETSAEKRRRIKAEEEEENTQTPRKRKKGKKKKPAAALQPLIHKPENAHFLKQFPDFEPQYVDTVQARKIEIHPIDPEGVGFLHPGTVMRKNKVLIFKKPSKNELKFEKFLVNDIPSAYKLDVASWNKEKEGNVSPCTNEDKPDEGSQANEDDVSRNILKSADDPSSSGNTSIALSSTGVNSETMACNPSDVKGESDRKIQDLESSRETLSLLYIDNSKFSSAPSNIDSEVMENFPLENTSSLGVQHETHMNGGDTSDKILTIAMFDGGYQQLPSVSKILEATMPEANRQVLERWKAKMIRELGEEGFEEYRKGLFDKGKLLHGCLQSELTGVSPGVENLPTVQGLWTSISHVLPSVTNVSVLESRLVHPYLFYQGAVDCVARYKGMPVLIDWKTSTKPKLTLKSMFDNPLQVVAYLGALNYDSNYQLPHQVQSAMVVVAYDSGLPAHVHIIDKEKCQAYWRLWCARLVQFWRQQQVTVST